MAFVLYFYSFWWIFLVLGSLDCQVSIKCLVVTCNKSHVMLRCTDILHKKTYLCKITLFMHKPTPFITPKHFLLRVAQWAR